VDVGEVGPKRCASESLSLKNDCIALDVVVVVLFVSTAIAAVAAVFVSW
jgi:hypothetical protein